MTRGSSLNQDLKFLINNPRYSDVEIICKNQEKLYGCRAILAARSEVFDALLYNGMKESYENQISFPTINSSEMEITLEYIYTGVIKEEVFTKDNIIEAFEVADYFQLPDLQDFVLKVVRTTLEGDHPNELIPDLLTKAIDTMVVTEDNVLLKLLAETLVSIPLNNIEFGRLSMPALRYFLSHSYLNELTLTVPEYEIFRHGAILAAMQVCADATKSLLRRLPAFEEIDDTMKNHDGFTYSRRVAETLDPLIELIDFKRIKYQTLVNLIKPLKIIPAEIISDDPRSKKSKPSDLNEIRTFPFGIDCIWDELACGSNLLIEENGTVVQARSGCNLHQSVRGKVELKRECIYEWDVIIDSHCFFAWVGVCASEGFNFGEYAGNQSAGWVLGSSGLCYHSGNWVNYCPPFVNDYIKKVTVHLDMKKRTCAFSVNGVKYPEVSGWDDLPSKLYPVVSLYSPGRFIIQPH